MILSTNTLSSIVQKPVFKEKTMDIEIFGYFKPTPFEWADCTEDEEGAIPLYDQETVDKLLARIRDLDGDKKVLDR